MRRPISSTRDTFGAVVSVLVGGIHSSLLIDPLQPLSSIQGAHAESLHRRPPHPLAFEFACTQRDAGPRVFDQRLRRRRRYPPFRWSGTNLAASCSPGSWQAARFVPRGVRSSARTHSSSILEAEALPGRLPDKVAQYTGIGPEGATPPKRISSPLPTKTRAKGCVRNWLKVFTGKGSAITSTS